MNNRDLMRNLKFIMLCVAVVLAACASTGNSEEAPATKVNLMTVPMPQAEPGYKLMRAYQQSADVASFVTEAKQLLKKDHIKRMVGSLNDAQYAVLYPLLAEMQRQEGDVTQAVRQLLNEPAMDKAKLIATVFQLFPVTRYPLYHRLRQDPALNELPWTQWANNKKILPPKFLPRQATDTHFVQPLIHSASITLFDKPATVANTVKYRAIGSQTWLQAMPLQHEPITNVLTGSIVHLAPATTYEVEVTLQNHNAAPAQQHLTFTTRANTPPINPDKVYQLADIYQGGTLDLAALNISGDENGWAKIVGSPELPVEANAGDNYAINIGAQSYIYFEDITVKGGRRFAVHSDKAHHLWFNQCDISGWGRAPGHIKNGVAYESENANNPINYDAGFYLKETGVVVVEHCHVHDPIPKANSWKNGHPQGPTAFLTHANHPNPAYKGQVILRHNTFEGKPEHRYNDIIEGRYNGEFYGAFVRDSAIYNNTFKYSNDDVIELDGSQYNVLVYNNDMSHTYAGISAIPNRLGPSYIFNNYLHDLGDDTGKMWTAIKVGGLYTRPTGRVNIWQNYITVYRNAIAASRFEGNSAFWLDVQNNVFITRSANNTSGFGIYDIQPYALSIYKNNYDYNLNTSAMRNKTAADIYSAPTQDIDLAAQAWSWFKDNQPMRQLPVNNALPALPNFAVQTGQHQLIGNYTMDSGQLKERPTN
tara:strand:+ start:16055 stop:18169 length:2115 start_codon:yes stop_codon:yes gene_type:complete